MSLSRSKRNIFLLLGALLFFTLLFVASEFLNPSSVGNPKFSSNFFIFALLSALNFLIVVSLAFVLLRNLIKLYFEYRGGRWGSRIKTKLVLTLVTLSLVPSVLLFLLAFGLINRKLQEWSSAPAETLVGSASRIAEAYYAQRQIDSIALAELLAGRYLEPGMAPTSIDPQRFLFEEVQAVAPSGTVIGEIPVKNSLGRDPRRTAALQRALQGHTFFNARRDIKLDHVLVAVPLRSGPGEAIQGALLASFSIPESVAFHAIEAQKAASRYADLQQQSHPLRTTYVLILGLTTFVVIFGFTWFGLYIAKKITVPIEALATGAREIASGNLNHRVECEAVDELGILVDGFNQMAGDLRRHKQELERTNEDLRISNLRLDDRRHYIETVLENVATGVVSLSRQGVVSTINRAAALILGVDRDRAAGQSLEAILPAGVAQEIARIVQKAQVFGSYRRDVTLERPQGSAHLAVTATVNYDAENSELGLLLVLDDITELIQAEKFAAWQEVARRMAHEIKNPLTPIQLSAEQILRRAERMGPGEGAEAYREFLLEVGRIIVQETRTLKNMVDEFSRFSRLPLARPVPCQLRQIIDDTLAAYNGRFQNVEIRTQIDPGATELHLDPDQFKRALINILDNAIEAMQETPRDKRVEITAAPNPRHRSVRIEIADNGQGISQEDYENLFLPYFSTKKRGTGLGLAIVRQIISEHHGYIRAEANHPHGSRFIIELPQA